MPIVRKQLKFSQAEGNNKAALITSSPKDVLVVFCVVACFLSLSSRQEEKISRSSQS